MYITSAPMEIEGNLSNNRRNNEKIEKVLMTILQPNFKIGNDVYLKLFLTRLIGKNDNGEIWRTNLELKEFFCQWIIQASNLWIPRKVNPEATILSFALNLASQLSADEEIFFKLNSQNVFESLVGVARINLKTDSAVTFGLVSLLCSFLEHKTGLQWVMATTHWTDMINLGLKAPVMYMRKKASQFVVKLLEKTINFNRNFAVSVVAMLNKPLKEVLRSLPCDENTQYTEFQSLELYAFLKPSLNLILEIIETLLKTFNRKVLHLFFKIEMPKTIEILLVLSRSGDFSFELLQIQFVFMFYQTCMKLDGLKAVDHDSVFEIKAMFDLIRNEMNKCNVQCVVKICDYAICLFCSLKSHMPTFLQKGNIIEFETQMVFCQLSPIYSVSSQILSEDKAASQMIKDTMRSDHFSQCLKISSFQVINMCYKWVQKLKTKPNLLDDIIFCCQYFVKRKKMFKKEQASIIFSALVYVFSDVLVSLKEKPGEFSHSYILFTKTVIETAVDIVESFDLTWKDCMETIRVMDIIYDFLEYTHWPDNMMVSGLKLLNTAISKCMSPDMVLLIYNSEDAKMSQTGTLLYSKCHDSSWEIRASALEIVYTLSRDAITKFPAYTNILLNAELPQWVVKMAFKDSESYVRATALKCLQELIQIPEIWDIFLNLDNFLDNVLDVFKNETESKVRKEAAALIYKIDKFQNFPEGKSPRLYDVMTHAAIGDQHWEVKCNALDFWFNLWEEHLTYQGMIDHKFPSYTFSKEQKKIVTLNEVEVRKRIIKVLNQLSHIGCLHVMKCAVEDDCDVEVSRKATSFTFKMLNMFKFYKIPCENVDLSPPPSPARQPKILPNQEPISPAASYETTATYPSSLGNSQIPCKNVDLSPLPSARQPKILPNQEPVSPAASYETSATYPASSGNSQIPCENVDLTRPLSPPRLPNSIPNHEPVSPAASPRSPAPDPAKIEYLGSPQFSNSPFFDPVSPFAPLSPSNDLGTITPPTSTASQASTLRNSPRQSQTAYVHNEAVLVQNPVSSPTQHDSSFSNSSPFPSGTDFTDMMDVFGYDDASMDSVQLENILRVDNLNPFGTEVLDEYLMSNDLQGLYNPTDQLTNNTTQMKTQTYLAPSQYMKFIYNEFETLEKEKTRSLNSLEEFDSLLDNILNEYNTVENVIIMDCC